MHIRLIHFGRLVCSSLHDMGRDIWSISPWASLASCTSLFLACLCLGVRSWTKTFSHPPSLACRKFFCVAYHSDSIFLAVQHDFQRPWFAGNFVFIRIVWHSFPKSNHFYKVKLVQMLGYGIPDNRFQNFWEMTSQADGSVIFWVVPTSLFVYRCDVCKFPIKWYLKTAE